MDWIPANVVQQNGRQVQIAMLVAEVEPWSIEVKLDLDERRFEAPDLFEAMILARVFLEERGFMLLCAGARRNVLPSGMSRSAGGGRRAYVLEMGRHPDREHLIDIFAPAKSTEVVKVEESRRFVEVWKQSVGLV